MIFLQDNAVLQWRNLLLGEEQWVFLIETVIRTSLMFIIIVVALRVLGKRGVKQLSVFELVVIIGLGSAAGDPMFYKDVGLLPALVVFVVVIGAYKLIVYLIGINKKFEILIEGKPICLIKEGVFAIDNFTKETLGEEEFFAELRLFSISQLGQIKEAIIETTGNISVFYYQPDEVKYGLPIMPGDIEKSVTKIIDVNYYSCVFCGYTELVSAPLEIKICPTCSHKEWLASSNRKRIR